MNVSPEHAQVIRDALAAGLTEFWLVVEGDQRHMRLNTTEARSQRFIPPADWVALTGACKLCEYGPPWVKANCPSCIDGRKRATLTVRGDFPAASVGGWETTLAVATVEVLPVVAWQAIWSRPAPCVEVQTATTCAVWLTADGNPIALTLHRQPVPGRDYVIHLTNLEAQ